jgi:hypothetical protein
MLLFKYFVRQGKTKNECHTATARSNINESANARDDKRRPAGIPNVTYILAGCTRLRRACHKVRHKGIKLCRLRRAWHKV